VGSIGFAHHIKEEGKQGSPILTLEDGGFHFTTEEEIHAPFFRSPSADLNFTLALAIISFTVIEIASFRTLGLSHLAKFFDYRVKVRKGFGILLTPLAFLANFFSKTLELILEFARIISFSFRLFGNIFAGEILLFVVTSLTYGVFTLPFIGLEIFVGFVQALVFIFLTMVFIKVGTEAHH
jgi:F-type H+-transporting ATPase subunit a